MSRELERLAERRAQLVARCAQQREEVAFQLSDLRAGLRLPFGLPSLSGLLAGRGKLRFALAGIALGLVATRPERLLSMAAAGLSMWRTARSVLPLLLAR